MIALAGLVHANGVRFDVFDLVVLDDLGYVQQSPEEAEVLFTLLAERYERKSVALTSNLVFSQWERIFKNPMTTAAAVDRLVHHAVILEFDVPSFRSAPATTASPDAAEALPPSPTKKPKSTPPKAKKR